MSQCEHCTAGHTAAGLKRRAPRSGRFISQETAVKIVTSSFDIEDIEEEWHDSEYPRQSMTANSAPAELASSSQASTVRPHVEAGPVF